MEKLVSLCRRRGFIFPSSEIYGGLSSCWDYGSLGVELKRNIKQAWWQAIVQQRGDFVGLDTSILMHPQVWEASGHLKGFSDPMVDCKECQQRWRTDELEGEVCPSCGGELTEPRQFNLMFKTFMGPVEDDASIVYLRPETAQGIFVNFQNVVNTTRKKLPFGIAQIGKSFRNEITTGNFIFRSREFEQMEIEYFVKPGTDEEWFEYWLKERMDWYIGLGIKKENLELRKHDRGELAHYARECFDINYNFPMGWSELEGIANRGDFDLVQHAEHSGKGLSYLDEETNEHIVPYIIEPSAGVDRSVLAFLCEAYDEEPDKDEIRTVLHLHPSLAPYKAAVLPLSKKEPLIQIADEIHAELRRCWMVSYDLAQSIGRRYRRQDEIGTPYCITIDFQSLEDKQVTIRERDSMKQLRIPISELNNTLAAKLGGEAFEILPPGGSHWLGF
ncbi:MAG TPA: glycine--tRNA ligase [Dehalococcoidia bacterium]|nr:glycine--tRNA ligase [Dehalococcoidia bacterium]